MESSRDAKRKKDKQDDDDYHKDRKHKRRSKSRSPARHRDKESRRKRKNSKSRSPEVPMKQEKTANDSKDSESKPAIPERKAKETDMLNTRTGGAYIPPARLRMMQAQITDKSSIAYQRLAWEALKKSIHGHINKINVGNIGIIIKELLKENIVRGRGLLCRSVIQAQAASPTFTNVYAALVAAVNSRFPNIGELLLKRLVIQFKRGFKRNDKPICISSASFIAHLVNQRVAHEILALELLTLLVESPTDDSVEVAIAFLKECGQKLTEVSSKGVNAIFEMLRNILHEGQLDKRVQYMIEVMFQVWKDGFKDHPALIEELELVPEEEQFTHLLMLDDATDSQDILNVFKFDEKYEENEQKYKTLSKEILGSDAESGEEDGSGESGSEDSEEDEAEDEQKPVTIIDNTETNLVALRRTIYLTINSSLDFEECAHKLMKMQLKPGQEVELCHMFLDCCAEQRTYEKFYGLLAQRFCNINRIYIGPFEEIFKDSYGTAHRLDTNRLRNVSKFFAHLLFTDSISWEVLECVKLNEEDTTSSSRIYIKILFQELAEYMGLKKLNDRLKDPTLQEAFLGIFPRDNPKNTRFSINFFTSIGLGGLTDELREHLKQMPKNVPAAVTEINVDSESSSSSSSSSDSSSDSSSSESEDEGNKQRKKKKDKNKGKSSKTDEDSEPKKNDTERWGHDGFYDTYGKDARRTESRPERNERDSDNFLKPRDVPRRREDDRSRNDRRNDDRRKPDERNGHDSYDNRRNRDDNRRDSNRRQNDERDEEARSRNREDGDRKRDRDSDRRQSDEEYARRSRDDASDRRRDKDTERRQNSDEEVSRGNRDDRTRDRDSDRRQRDERSEESSRKNREDENDRRRDKNYDRDEEVKRNRENASDRRRDKDSDRRQIVEREDVNSKRNREDGSDRRRDKDTDRRKNHDRDEDSSRKYREDSGEMRHDRDRDDASDRKRDRDNDRREVDESDRSRESRKDKRRDRDLEREEYDDKNVGRRYYESRHDDESLEYKKDRRNKKDSGYEEQSRDKNEKIKSEDDRSSDDSGEKRHKKRKQADSDEEKTKKKKDSRKKESKSKKKHKKKVESSSSEDDSSSSDDSSSEEESVSRKKGKSKVRPEDSDKELADGWDIRRRASIQRELGSRYWAK
ncbi:pre-mRNA-splicing factor CWC22 homolog [Ostrinia furnacalis]|uniref:pre-mRNA-splicing factor CWC22 homolog n=1 Tax=Ostrinia furnacalis TaxID=93504 RepID=UPI00103C4493|nr:pre-mRNA-splicing factor CWC22 homolog [Ostrinia furnacalis]